MADSEISPALMAWAKNYQQKFPNAQLKDIIAAGKFYGVDNATLADINEAENRRQQQAAQPPNLSLTQKMPPTSANGLMAPAIGNPQPQVNINNTPVMSGQSPQTMDTQLSQVQLNEQMQNSLMSPQARLNALLRHQADQNNTDETPQPSDLDTSQYKDVPSHFQKLKQQVQPPDEDEDQEVTKQPRQFSTPTS